MAHKRVQWTLRCVRHSHALTCVHLHIIWGSDEAIYPSWSVSSTRGAALCRSCSGPRTRECEEDEQGCGVGKRQWHLFGYEACLPQFASDDRMGDANHDLQWFGKFLGEPG